MPKNSSMGPLPEDGEEYHEDVTLPDDDDDNNEPEAPKPPVDPRDAELAALRATVDGLQASINSLRAPAPAPAPTPKEPEIDWEDLMFKDPKEYNRLLRENVKKEIANELRGEYQKDQGTKDFWNAFYTDHPDLKGDDDLVKTILNSNLSDLAPMPVKAAGDKLAELTRARILKYTGGKMPAGKKVVTEGAGSPTPPKKETQPNAVVSLSDLLRARRAKRMNKGTAA